MLIKEIIAECIVMTLHILDQYKTTYSLLTDFASIKHWYPFPECLALAIETEVV